MVRIVWQGWVMAHEYRDIREQILEAAREVFAKYGYRKTTIEDISSAVYKAKSSVYHYFNGKEEIFREVIEIEAAQLMKQLQEAISVEETPVRKFTTLFKFLCFRMKEMTNYYRFLRDDWHDIFDFTEEVRLKNTRLFRDIILSIFLEGNRQGVFAIEDPERKADAIRIALLGFIAPWGVLAGQESLDNIDPFMDIVLNGILVR
jgi:AcrR family transcriptional regulator